MARIHCPASEVLSSAPRQRCCILLNKETPNWHYVPDFKLQSQLILFHQIHEPKAWLHVLPFKEKRSSFPLPECQDTQDKNKNSNILVKNIFPQEIQFFLNFPILKHLLKMN